MKKLSSRLLPAAYVPLLCCLLLSPAMGQAKGSIEFDFRDEKSDAELICRVKILSADGKAQRVPGMLFQQGWNLWDGTKRFSGRVGEYKYQAFHGLQYSAATGGFTLDRKSSAQELVRLPRHADLDLEGWRGGDLLSYVDPTETLRWLPAEELYMAAIVSNDRIAQTPRLRDAGAFDVQRDNWVGGLGYIDHRPGSGLVLQYWLPPAPVPSDLPSSRLLEMAKRQPPREGELPVHAEIGRLWERDVPIWLASGKIDSIQLLGSHLTFDGQRQTPVEPLVDPDPGRFRGPRAGGRLVEYLYWQVLECGLRLPPTAGSGFGKNGSPLGYNRVYAYAPLQSPTAWWQAVRDGQTFVTNGPLLRATVNGELPGKVFTAEAGGAIELDVSLKLTIADPVEYLEVVFNGATLYRARLDEYARQGGKIPPQAVRESGWLLIRVVTERDNTYRMATTAPYYFEFGGQPRISRQAVAIFQAWLEKSAERVAEQGELATPASRAVEPYIEAARTFWLERAKRATID